MTQEIFERLNKFEKVLSNAVRCDFVRVSSLDFCEIAGIYAQLFGVELTQRQKNCNTCRLNALKKVGEEYFAYQQELARKQTEKRKGGRPKKIEGMDDAKK